MPANTCPANKALVSGCKNMLISSMTSLKSGGVIRANPYPRIGSIFRCFNPSGKSGVGYSRKHLFLGVFKGFE